MKEFELIKVIREICECSNFLGLDHAQIVGIGDDCAVLPGSLWSATPQESARSPDQLTYQMIISTDLLNEGVHFRQSTISPRDLGYKATAVNLSDIAAKGGAAMGLLISLGLPNPESQAALEWVKEFYEGAKECTNLVGARILGGDTTRSLHEIVINVTVFGRVATQKLKLRSAAQLRDLIVVTGFLGDSAAGLRLLEAQLGVSNRADGQGSGVGDAEKKLITRHRRPPLWQPQAQFLAGFEAVHAMMDISDGIGGDILRICEQSKLGVRLEVVQLPLSPELKAVAEHYRWNAFELACSGGEDYGLLLTVDSKVWPELQKQWVANFQEPITAVGEIETAEIQLAQFNGVASSSWFYGFDHSVQ